MSEEKEKALYPNELENLLNQNIPDLRAAIDSSGAKSHLDDQCLGQLNLLVGVIELWGMFKKDMELARRAPKTKLVSAFAAMRSAGSSIQKACNFLNSDKEDKFEATRAWLRNTPAVKDIDGEYQQVHRHLGEIINWGKIIAERSIDGYLGAKKKELDEIATMKDDATAMVAEISTVHERADKYMRGEGIAAHADMMKSEAECHKVRAIQWGAATFIICVGVVFLIWHYGKKAVPESSASTGVALQMAVVKIALVSICMFVIFFCGRACQSHMHNATVNRHRYNALRTWELFIEGGRLDEATYDTLLLYVAQAIFAPQRTGFIGRDPAVSAMSPAIGIVKEMTKGSAS